MVARRKTYMGDEPKIEDIIIASIRNSINKTYDVDLAVRKEDFFASDLGLDSLDMIEMLLELEDFFDIDISKEDADKIKTVEDSINTVKNYVESKDN